MNTNTNTATVYDFTGMYGQDWTQGVLVDHLDRATAAGMVVRTMPASRRQYVTGPRGGVAFPVVCGDLVEVWTEDGRMDGRCGLPVLAGAPACEAHAEQIAYWAAQTEAEAMAWERENDRI